MDKAAMYSAMASTHPPPYKRRWVTWTAVGMSLVALVVAGVTASMAVRQMDRANQMEGRLMEMEEKVVEMEGHMLEVLEYSLASHDYFDYEDDLEGDDDDDDAPTDYDSQAGPYEHLTVHRVVRRRRQVNSVKTDNSQGPAVPIYDQAYGVNLKGRSNYEGLRLYESLQATKGVGDPTSPEVTVEVTESPIKPYHRISSLWVPKKSRRRYPASSLSTRNLDRDDDNKNAKVNRRRAAMTERRSRTKSLHGSGRGVRPRQKHRALSNQNPVSVQFRDTRVKATSRHDGFDSGQNSVVPKPAPLPESSGSTVVVQQGPGLLFSRGTPEGYTRHPTSTLTKGAPRKRRPRKRRGGRRRRNRSATSLAHFVASNTTSIGSPNAPHHAWTPAAWMDKLGLNRKYSLDQDTVVVKESGLYYIYAQVLYESGQSGSGFQILVDDIPIMECTLAPAQPSPSCHTAGASYLPRHAVVAVSDLDQHTRPVRSHHNTFFGLVKLMDAPDTAEKLLLP